MLLRNANARLSVLRKDVDSARKKREELEVLYAETEKQKHDMEVKFNSVASHLNSQSDYKNSLLNEKLHSYELELEKKEAHLTDVVQRAGFDQKSVDEIMKKMEEAIEAKNSILRNLKYSLAHATKAYNDAIRVYEAKLREFGIPAEELGLELLETNTSTMPAGLVAA